MAAVKRIPSPADAPSMTAKTLLRRIRREGGRIYRMRENHVFVLTDSSELAQWLLSLGAITYLPRGAEISLQVSPLGAFRMAKDSRPQWDIYVHPIPVLGETTVWEAAGEISDVGLYEIGDEEPTV